MYAFSPTGIPIVGTLERREACATITAKSFEIGQNGELSFEWTGETEIFWDEGEAILTGRTDFLFLDAEGEVWPETAVVLNADPNWSPPRIG